jgi:rare lipoprotein A
MRIRLLIVIAALIVSAATVYSPIARGKPCKHGHASYYERCFGTCETANGEWFKPDGISAAHKSLPFGTVLSVTNKRNGKAIKVRVNDRGPFVKGRDLDLSRGAMRKLGGLGSGVIPVKYCVVQS